LRGKVLRRKMMNRSIILVLAITFLALTLPSSVLADRSHRIHTPRGEVITLVIASSVLKNTRIHDLEFSESGDVFLITAAPLPSADSMQTISISFHQGSTVAQTDYVEIGPGKTVQEVYCPESFDQIVIDSSGY
jgi:hypothetical protein